ncbi:MAG: NAD-dependent epimerase/dehydratase family protein [bacterium]|nr:NAD-dependent epimerase/dehydratase family protein [bacterium]
MASSPLKTDHFRNPYSFEGKKVLVAGGTGLIGIPLVKLLLKKGAVVRIASLDDPSRTHPEAEFLRTDLTILDNCLWACQDIDYVFNLLCVKGSPAAMAASPATVFYNMMIFNTQLLEAAKRCETEGFLFTSTLGVYGPAPTFLEDEAWQKPPSEHDKAAGWVKRMGELQAELYEKQYGWQNINIVRPATVYGPYDNFDSSNSMVVPALIKRVVSNEDPLVIWGNGSAVRDFIYTEDVAKGMLLVAETNPGLPVNIGSGRSTSIRELAETIIRLSGHHPEITWDTSKPRGDQARVLDTSRAQGLGWKPLVSLEDGLRETMHWYDKHRHETNKRWDIFNNP